MANADITVIDKPVEGFVDDDLFFSRTDERGVILGGNEVFTRLSGYSRQELIGAPHKRIRHPHMPRAVFQMMWDDLKAGRSFAGYVKNRAKCGRYYWVLALSLPVKDGHLSVRMKPGGKMVEKIEKIYAEIRRAELADGQSPEAGVAVVEQFVRDAGYADYRDFATEALFNEGAARRAKMDLPPDPLHETFAEVRARIQDLDATMAKIVLLLQRTRGSPTNLSIQGKRLQSSTETLKVIAQNYSLLSEQIQRAVVEMQSVMTELKDAAQSGRRGHCAYMLLAEAIPRYMREQAEGQTDASKFEVSFLTSALDTFKASIAAGYGRVRSDVNAFSEVALNLKRIVSGLAMTRVMCRMEAARVKSDVGGIDEINRQLGVFQTELAQSLDQMMDSCLSLIRNMDRINGQRSLGRVA